MRKNIMIQIVVLAFTLLAVDIREGELWRITMEITEGEVTYDRELYALAGENNLLLMPDMLGVYECVDSGIIVKKYGTYAALVNGKQDRTVSSHRVALLTNRVVMPGDSTISWTTGFNRVMPGDTGALKEFRGVLLDTYRNSVKALFVADTLYSFEDGVCMKLSIVSKSGTQLEVRYENGEVLDECIDLQKVDGIFTTLDSVESLIDSLIPLHESASSAELLKIAAGDWDSTLFSEYDYVKLLQNFTYNNYGFLTVRAMRTLHFLLNARFESITHELMFFLGDYCENNRYSVEDIAERVDKRLRRKRIKLSKDDPDRVTKGLFLLYLDDTIKPMSGDERRLFSLLKRGISQYRRDEM